MHRLAVLEMILAGQFEGKIYILQEDVTDDVVSILRSYKEAISTPQKSPEGAAKEGEVEKSKRLIDWVIIRVWFFSRHRLGITYFPKILWRLREWARGGVRQV